MFNTPPALACCRGEGYKDKVAIKSRSKDASQAYEVYSNYINRIHCFF